MGDSSLSYQDLRTSNVNFVNVYAFFYETCTSTATLVLLKFKTEIQKPSEKLSGQSEAVSRPMISSISPISVAMFSCT